MDVIVPPIPAIRLGEVTVRFGAVHALDRLSLEVPVGTVTGLIGRNGAGKSTTIRVLAGLLQPSDSAGHVLLFGNGYADQRERILASTGFLLADPALLPYLTPRETLLFLARAYGIGSAEGQRRAGELVDFFELAETADRLVDELSTGTVKRVAIAASLIHAPRLLVLDEPFESLDPLMVRQLKKLIGGYARGGGSVLLSSHLIDAVDEVCDHIVILEGGRVVTAGTTEAAKASIADRLPSATLEDLYATLMPQGDVPELRWLLRFRGEATADAHDQG